MSELKKILESFCRLDGVRGAMVVGHDGSVSESFLDHHVDAQKVAHLVTSCTALGQTMARDLNLDAVNQSYVQCAQFSITAELLASQACLVILADSGANLGRIRLEIRKNRKMIENLGV